MRVRVWRNSRRRGWSVRPVGSHKSPTVLPTLCLRDVTFRVNRGLYDRRLDTGAPATFAWAEGELCADPGDEEAARGAGFIVPGVPLPWRRARFVPAAFVDHEGPLTTARYARFRDDLRVIR